ncbi:MAG: S9 family peptidase [Ignavibacteriota bacterium]
MKYFLLLFLVSVSYCQPKIDPTPYLQMRGGAGTPSLSPDGKWCVFTSSASGVSQLWRTPAKATPDGAAYWPDQLTFFTDAIGSGQYSPDGKWLLFAMDHNGDERRQMYLMSSDGGVVDSLTKNPKAMYGGFFSDDGKYIYYYSNQRNEAYYDIFRMDLVNRKSTLLHQSDHQNALLRVSPDNRWLFIGRDSGNANDWVYVKDLEHQSATDEPRLLTPHTEPANYNGFHVSHDSKKLYFFTNEGRDFSNRAYLDFHDLNAKVTFREDIKWDLDQDSFDKNDKVEVITRNVDGIGNITIIDPATGKALPSPKLPEGGFISNLNISEDAMKIAFNFTSPTEIGNLYIFDRATNRTEAIAKPNYAGLDPKSFVSSKLIHFPSFDGAMIPAFYYEGKSATSKKMPVIVMMHGGPESQDRPWFNPIAQYFVRRGYSVLDPNVRGSTGYGKAYSAADNTTKRMTSVRDMEYAAYWLAKQPGVDSNKRIIFGGSYGGFMSLAAMTMQSDIWAAGVDLFGIANFHSFLKNTGAWRQKNRMAEYGNIVTDSAFLYNISPLTHVGNIKKPLFVFQGKNDPRVPPSESEQIVEAVKQKGIPVEYVLLPDEGHGISKRENRVKVYTAIVDFLDKVLQ